MKPAPFAYYAPQSLEEAVGLLAQFGYDAKLLAGGQSLVPTMNFRLSQPGVLVDLNRVRELDYLAETDGGGLQIGAMTRQRLLERSPVVAARAPLLHETMPHIAHMQIRNRGTLGGSIAHADPAAELPVIAVALDATFTIQSSSGTRQSAARDFFIGLFTTDLAPDEVLTSVEIPPLPPRTGTAFAEFARRAGDYAIAGCAAVVTLDEVGACAAARLVYLSVGDVPMEAFQGQQVLLGEVPTAERIAEAARVAAEKDIDPLGDMHATAQYRRHLAQVLARRVLTTAAQRANSTT